MTAVKLVKKKDFDFKSKYSVKTKYKEESFYSCGDVFNSACGLPGPLKGTINMFLGHTNTSKTTAMILAAVDAQKQGDIPVFIITERKWSWEHAVLLGLDAKQNEDGEWVGNFIFNDSFDYLEQAIDYVNDILDDQVKGNIPHSLLFCWDSIGSIPCLMTYEGKGGKQHTAGVLADKVGMGIHARIGKTRKEDCPYYATMIFVNQPWVERPDNIFAQPNIKAKGGDAIWLASALVFLFGQPTKGGINHIDAVKNKRKISYAIRTKISIIKNHVNGLGFKDGKIIAVPQGYIEDSKESLDNYKKNNSDYWNKIFGVDDGEEFELIETVSFDNDIDD